MTFAIFFVSFVTMFFAVLNLLPDATPLPQEFSNGFATIVGNMKAWDIIFPITELLTLLTIVIVFEASIWLFRAFMGIIRIVRGGTS